MLRGVDLLVYDIQDVGVRFYTYISTLYECMKAAARDGIPLIVLDRPNPIDGDRVEGPLLDTSLVSFVGIHPLPIRYGMTVGELARLFNHEGELGCDLRVVPMQGWRRSRWFDETGLVWIPPSPNMPTLTTATLYAGFCLLEGTNLSEGRGTTRPFELVGAPWLDAPRLAESLNALDLAGVYFRVQSFTPTFSKFKDQVCQGIQIHVVDRDRFDPISGALHLLLQTLDLHPEELKFQDQNVRSAGGSTRSQIRSSYGAIPVEQIGVFVAVRNWSHSGNGESRHLLLSRRMRGFHRQKPEDLPNMPAVGAPRCGCPLRLATRLW